MLQLVTAKPNQTPDLVSQLLRQASLESDCEREKTIVELTEEILIRRYHEFDRDEIRRMFKLQDIRKTRVWKEAHEVGVEEGIEKGRELEKQQLIQRLQSKGHTLKEIAQLLDIPLAEVRRLANR
jgi:predicted transposase/invertase (TIGR01784 family)